MTDFEQTLRKLNDEAFLIQQEEITLQAKAKLFQQKLSGFLKESGLPDNFTVPELALLAVKKSRAQTPEVLPPVA